MNTNKFGCDSRRKERGACRSRNLAGEGESDAARYAFYLSLGGFLPPVGVFAAMLAVYALKEIWQSPHLGGDWTAIAALLNLFNWLFLLSVLSFSVAF